MSSNPAAMGFRGQQTGVDDGPGITFDEVGVRRSLGGDRSESVRWDGLRAVLINTTADGPFSEDVFYVLVGDAGDGCVVPQGFMPPGLLERLQTLPGFDNDAVIEAMGSIEEATFTVWERPGD